STVSTGAGGFGRGSRPIGAAVSRGHAAAGLFSPGNYAPSWILLPPAGRRRRRRARQGGSGCAGSGARRATPDRPGAGGPFQAAVPGDAQGRGGGAPRGGPASQLRAFPPRGGGGRVA